MKRFSLRGRFVLGFIRIGAPVRSNFGRFRAKPATDAGGSAARQRNGAGAEETQSDLDHKQY